MSDDPETMDECIQRVLRPLMFEPLDAKSCVRAKCLLEEHLIPVDRVEHDGRSSLIVVLKNGETWEFP